MAALMAPYKLTDGAVMVICKREPTAEMFQPIVQVFELKLVNTSQQSGNERYRLLLSDGTHFQQGMLGTQLNGLVKSGKLQKGSVVHLKQYVCNPVQDRLYVLLQTESVYFDIYLLSTYDCLELMCSVKRRKSIFHDFVI